MISVAPFEGPGDHSKPVCVVVLSVGFSWRFWGMFGVVQAMISTYAYPLEQAQLVALT